MRNTFLFLLTVFTFVAADDTASPSAPRPPVARVQPVEETMHGRKIVDPYRWLEDSNSNETQQWTRQQLEYTRAVLGAQPVREQIRRRLAPLLQTGEIKPPRVIGSLFFYTKRQGDQNQPILYVREGLKGSDRVLIDPNKLSAEGVVALDWWHPSKDGKYVAFGTSPGGSEISTLQIVETATGRLLAEKIDRCRFADVEWLPDNSGFFYTKYPRPGDVPAGQEMYNRHVYFHKVGVNLDGRADKKIFGEGRSPEELPSLNLSDDGRWLVVKAGVTFDRTDLFIKDVSKADTQFTTMIAGKNFIYDVEFAGNDVIIHTNEDAPKYRVFRVSAERPERAAWKQIVGESDAVLRSIKIVGGKLLGEYEHAGVSSLRLYDLTGKQLREIKMPGIGQIESLGGGSKSQLAFYNFETFLSPHTVYSFDVNNGASKVWAQLPAPLNPGEFETKQVHYVSKDGTKVPMFIVHKKGVQLNGKNPTLLAGYGGFNISRKPAFYGWLQLWLERGGIYADAGLRGGSEYGETWHRDGMLERKQNVFDDFIAAAEYLIAQKYTDRDHLAVYGRSNGGLLTGAVLTQRPDLFRAVVCGVPLLDMLRYQNFQIARLWIPEYGTAEKPEQFKFIYPYSPYHHVKEKAEYPALLIFTSDGDTRVDPLHARKMTAKLQAAATNGPDKPILLRIEPKAGHGAGKPISKQVEEWADIMTFLFWQLGLK